MSILFNRAIYGINMLTREVHFLLFMGKQMKNRLTHFQIQYNGINHMFLHNFTRLSILDSTRA